MKNPVLMPKLFGAILSAIALISPVALTSCGSGAGGDGGAEAAIAPESLDGLDFDFFGAFELQFSRFAGTRGNESGGFDYTRRGSFFLGIPGGGTGAVGQTIELPSALENRNYQYVRTGVDTATITLTFDNPQADPVSPATAGDPTRNGTGYMFWGPNLENSGLTLQIDLLFSNNNGRLGDRVARIRSAYYFFSQWDAGSTSAISSTQTIEFDTPGVVVARLNGQSVPTGYDPYDTDIGPGIPNRGVWTTLSQRAINFNLIGSVDVARFVRDPSVVAPALPGGTPEESGRAALDLIGGPNNVSATYAYRRTGGNNADIALRYNAGSGVVTEIYTINFTNLTSGTFGIGATTGGTFEETVYQVIP